MKMRKKMLSLLLTGAMVITGIVPAGAAEIPVVGEEVAGVADSDMILHWDMTTNDDGTLKDLTGNNHSGIKEGQVDAAQIEGIDVMNLTGGYVTIPDGTIGSDVTEITVNMLVKIPKNIKSSWMWCLGTSNKRYMYLTGCANQDSFMRGGVGNAPDNGNGWSYESVVGGSSALAENEWQNITVTYKDGGSFVFYKNGEKQAEQVISEGAANNATTCTLQGLLKSGDGLDGYMGHSFYYPDDPNFQGSVADFRIYNGEMNATEVAEMADDMDQMLESLKGFTAEDVNLTEGDCLGSNTSKDTISSDLVLPETTTLGTDQKEAAITKWVSSNPDVISNDGRVSIPICDETVTMTATVERNGNTADKVLTFIVPGSASEEELVKADADALVVNNSDDVRGNLTLPTVGEFGSEITWASSDESIISTEASDEVAAGVVNRPSKDTKVTLTATVTYGEAVVTKEIVCNVKKAVGEIETTDYLFAYFPYTSTKDERIYFGISEDGRNFDALNNSQFVLESKLGTHGLRDPFVIRSPEGDKFYLIATDLTVAGINQDGVNYPGMSWGENQVKGSQAIMVWESEDLVNWSEQRMCTVSANVGAGCTWAPEAYWDDLTQQYVVFWASKASVDNFAKQRVYYATTRDFYTFSDAQVWIEENGSVIDTTVIKVGDYYYRYTKNEDGNTNQYGTPSKRVYCERSKSLTAAKWELVNNNSLPYSGGQIEGPCIFKINTDDVESAKAAAALVNVELTGDEVYCLTADATGSTIFPGLSSDITTGGFGILGQKKQVTVGGTSIYAMPDPDASHGTIMPITSEEYNNLMMKYDSSYANKAAAAKQQAEEGADSIVLDTAEAVTEDLVLPSKTENGLDIVWTTSDSAVITADGKVTRPEGSDAIVTLTATVTAAGTDSVRAQSVSKDFVFTVKAVEATPIPVNKDALQIAVGAAISSDRKDEYTADSWAAYEEALQDAKEVLAKEDATQDEVNKALTDLQAKQDALVKTEEPTPTPDPTGTPEPTGTPNPTVTPSPKPTAPETDIHKDHVGKTFVVDGLKYKVTKDDGKVQEVRATSLKDKKLKKLVIPKTVTNSKWGETFKVTQVKAKAFKGTAVTKVTIGANVTRIGPNAFLNCKKLKTVVIKKNVKTIGKRAFYGCAKLTKVTIKSKVLQTVKTNAFKRISGKAVIKVPKAKKAAYKKLLKGKISKGVKIK